MPIFGELLRARLDEAALSRRVFAGAVGVSQGFVTKVCLGARLPPLAQLAAWAAALGLPASQVAPFLRAGQLAHAPEPVQQLVEQLERAVARLRKRAVAADAGRPPTRRRGQYTPRAPSRTTLTRSRRRR